MAGQFSQEFKDETSHVSPNLFEGRLAPNRLLGSSVCYSSSFYMLLAGLAGQFIVERGRAQEGRGIGYIHNNL